MSHVVGAKKQEASNRKNEKSSEKKIRIIKVKISDITGFFGYRWKWAKGVGNGDGKRLFLG